MSTRIAAKLSVLLKRVVRGVPSSARIAAGAAVVVLFVGFVVIRSGAASFFAAIEGEQGTLGGNAQIVNDSGASGGKAILFAAADTSPPPPPPPPPPPAGQSCPAYPAFPDASCTGVPAGITLSNYTGPCTITVSNTVIDSKIVNCRLVIQASGVVIKNSRINGGVNTANESPAYSFTITDSEIIAPMATDWEGETGLGFANFTAIRVDVSGGNRGVYCKNCTIQDSWIHGQKIASSPRIHASGIRMSQGAKIIHNRIVCEPLDTPTDGGCSADLTGYGDFEPVRDNRIEKNLFMATPGGVCAYGGSSGEDGGKPYGNQTANIVFIDNVFQRGPTGQCGRWLPILDFNPSRPGNQWINNRWEDGGLVSPT